MLNIVYDTFDKLFGGSEIGDDYWMFVFIDEYILRLDISVGDGEHIEVVKSSKELIGV